MLSTAPHPHPTAAPQRCPQSPEAGKDLARISFWRAGKGGLSCPQLGSRPGPEGSSGMFFPFLVPALVPLPART